MEFWGKPTGVVVESDTKDDIIEAIKILYPEARIIKENKE